MKCDKCGGELSFSMAFLDWFCPCCDNNDVGERD